MANIVYPSVTWESTGNYQEELAKSFSELSPEDRQRAININTKAQEDLLNNIAFNSDSYTRDPISKAAMDRLNYTGRVPFGYEDSYSFGKGVLGFNRYKQGDESTRQVYLPGNIANNVNGMPILRHEANHFYFPNEEANRSFDSLYTYQNPDNSMNNYMNKQYEQYIPSDKRDAALGKMLFSAMQQIQTNPEFGSNNYVEPKFLKGKEKVDLTVDSLSKLPKEDVINLLNYAAYKKNNNSLTDITLGNYPHKQDPRVAIIRRDLPNVGLWDEFSNKIKKAFLPNPE